MKEGYIVEIEDLPEKCSCGSKKGATVREAIEAPTGQLLKEISCRGCGKKTLILDEIAQWQLERKREKYRPTWYLLETGEIIHWSSRKEEGK